MVSFCTSGERPLAHAIITVEQSKHSPLLLRITNDDYIVAETVFEEWIVGREKGIS